MTAAETRRPGVTCSPCHSLSCPTTAAGLFFAPAASRASLAPAPGTWWTRVADRADAAIRPLTSHAMPMPNGTRNPTLKTLSGRLPLTQRTDRNIWALWWISFSRGSKQRAWADLRVWWSCHVRKSRCEGCWSWSDVDLTSFLPIKKNKKKPDAWCTFFLIHLCFLPQCWKIFQQWNCPISLLFVHHNE